MSAQTPLSFVIVTGIALAAAGCSRGCAGDSASAPQSPAAQAPAQQPAAQQPAAQPAVPQPAPRPAVAPLRAAQPDPGWATISVTSEPPQGAAATEDYDHDGTPDAYVAGSCTVARHLARGWASVTLGTLSQPENSECGAPLRVAGRWLFPVTGGGHETDEGRSYTWKEAGLHALPVDAASTEVWGARVEDNNGNAAGEFRFEALGDGAVLVSAQMGDATPPGQSGPMFQVARWDAAAGRFAVASCWQATRPAAAPAGAAACTATPGASFHLRDTQTLSSENAREYPAGTTVAVLAAGALRRGEATLHCVRAPDGTVGYAFLTAEEARGCPTPLPASN